MPDVVDLIMADHREVERLFEILKSKPDQRAVAFPTLSALLIAHSRAEEAEVYPVARAEAGETDEVAHSQEEHAEAEELLVQLGKLDPMGQEYEPALQKLVDAVTHHVEEEESNVLPGMRERLDDARREELGEAFSRSRAEHLGDQPGQATKEELLTQAKNADVDAPTTKTKDQLKGALKPD
jgi:hemerythrin superfamily protein